MIAYLTGKFVEINPAYIIVETSGGVAYTVHIPISTYSQVKALETGKLLTHFHVKEDAQTLYGFYTESERAAFRYLISVNGIGPNTALLFLSSLSITEIQHAILTNNVVLLQSVKGVGNKTAQRVVIELKDKIGKLDADVSFDKKTDGYHNNNKNEALSALLSLGFAKNSAEKVLDKIVNGKGNDLSVEELIKKALKLL